MARSVETNDTRATSNKLLIIAAMAASVVVSHALARATFPVLLPAIESELLSNRQESGLLGSANFVAYLVGVAIATMISGRFEPVRLLRTGLTVATIGFVLLAVADRFALLAAGQALTGLGGAAIWMSAPTIATGAATPERRGMVMGFMSSSMGLGILLASQGTSLVRVVADDDSLWRPTWVGAAAFSGTIVAIVAVVKLATTETVAGGISIARLRTVPRWLVLSVAYFLFGLISSSFPGFFGLLLKDQGFSPNHITNLFSLFGLAAVVGAVTLGRVSDAVGRRPVLLAAMIAICGSCGLALIGREPYASISVAVYGAASFTFPVLVVTYLRDYLEDRTFSNALGALTIIYGVALTIGPAVSGTIADTSLGLEAVFIGLGAIAAASAAFVVFLSDGATDDRSGLAEQRG
jgi:MFS family permease